jgi:hypothetical protein
MIDIYIKILLIAIGIATVDKLKHEKKRDGILLGRSFPFKKVYWDHKTYWHCLILGVTNCGKSVLCENIIQGKNCVLINTWESDFKSLPNAKRINDKASIISFFKCLSDNTEEVFIVIDELASLMTDKEVAKEINLALQYSRHYFAHIIGITPRILANEVQCKALFPCRITGRLLQESDYRTALGISININLAMQEFIIIQDKVEVFRSETNRKYINT